ncbi:MAG: hypothetical protein J0I43_09550 [Microbacterium sp.]|nr:hypothetical protein [Microbacterium sp.]
MNTVRAAALTVALILAPSLTGCAAGAPAPAPTSDAGDLPPGVTVALTQQRSDVAARQAEVQIHNGTGSPLRIGDVQLIDPRFAHPATRVVDRTSTLAPDATVNIRVQLPEAACGAGDDAASTVTFAYENDENDGSDGRSGSATAAAGELFPFLAELHRRDCVAQAVDAAASVTFGDFTPAAAGSPATLDLAIVPTPGADMDVVLIGIRETNLLTFAGLEDGALPLALEIASGDDATKAIPLPLLPSRCDPHAVQEDKRGTVFAVDVTVDGEPGQFLLAAPPDLRGRLLTWVTQWCGG